MPYFRKQNDHTRLPSIRIPNNYKETEDNANTTNSHKHRSRLSRPGGTLTSNTKLIQLTFGAYLDVVFTPYLSDVRYTREDGQFQKKENQSSIHTCDDFRC